MQGPGEANEAVMRQTGLRQDVEMVQNDDSQRIAIDQSGDSTGGNTLSARQNRMNDSHCLHERLQQALALLSYCTGRFTP